MNYDLQKNDSEFLIAICHALNCGGREQFNAKRDRYRLKIL